jgi:ribosomal protein S24E
MKSSIKVEIKFIGQDKITHKELRRILKQDLYLSHTKIIIKKIK